MTTKLPNPSYTPETIVIVSLLNFFITRSGLEDQILARTVEKERNDLEQEKQRLTRDCAEKNRELKELQENILRMLEEAEGDILDQEELIDALEKSKLKSTEISEDLVRARATEVTIDETRNKYRPHAYRGALLFFCVSELSTVDPMYQFSLQWYINLVLLAIENTEAAVDIEERVEKLIEFFTYSFYTNVCRSLFERHKLTFSFFLCTSILQQQDELDGNEYHYLLTGPTGSGGEEPNPAPDWLTENSWNEIQFVSSNLPNFAGFAEHVTQCINYYKELFDSLNAHTYPLAAEWQGRETPLQRLVVVRCFRRDKVASAIQEFVKHYMGERFIIVPQFDLMDAYKDSTCLTPLIFIISPGSDPMNDLLRFAEHMRMSKKLDKVSLGQGQGRKAEELLSNGRERGQWVLLQNCHLATSWMPTLEAIVESFTLETVRKEFRLWLTSMPSDSFPVAVLQISVKMTNEPPMGLRANVTRSYYGLTDDDLEHPTKPNQFKKMVFAFCLFHAVIQERRKFGSLGFNIAYEFNDSDRNVCLLQLRKFISLYEDVPFDVLTFLTGEINYGGRVTDDWDRRCMMALIKDFITPGVLEEGYSFSPSGTYHTVEACSRAFYLDYLGTWPLNPEPEVFGLSDNADITCAQSESASILATILSLVSRESSGSSHQSREEMLIKTAQHIMEKLPPTFNVQEFHAKYPTKYEESMNTVLVQEAVRYNRLLRFVQKSLSEFSKAVRGEVDMSAELEAVGSSFFINAVPASWAALAYPSLKPLSSWVEDLLRRVQFVQSWYDKGMPNALWMGGFFFPQAFLTGTLQNYARRKDVAIDSVSFNFSFLQDETPTTVAAPEQGAIVYGLYLEGARWDGAGRTLAESRPKELYVDVPLLHLDPVVDRVADPNDYICPVYKTLTRAGTLSTTGHSTNFVLSITIPTVAPPEHWIKRGVACVISLNF
ncbi:dynein heavy chain [Trypanosoma brucei equiperdum]|nr:dynein heavy chain [Trypanosoma brucei equiperdum]